MWPTSSSFAGCRRPSCHLGGSSEASFPSSTSAGRGPSGLARRVLQFESLQEIVVSVVGWSVLLSSSFILAVAASTDEENSPRNYLRRKQSRGQRGAQRPALRPVVCLGDSLTRGNLSADWVGNLRSRLATRVDLPNVVLNAGQNMQCAQNILRRIDEVVACKPSHVVVLVGTNDLKGELSAAEGMTYKVCNDLEQPPTLAAFEQDILQIRDRLLSCGAKVALVSPPVLGEDGLCAANLRAAAYAAVVRHAAEEANCSYLPLFERTSAKVPNTGGTSYNSLQSFMWLCSLVADIHLLRRDLADVMRERELSVTVDLVHLGPEASEQLATMVEDFIENSVTAGDYVNHVAMPEPVASPEPISVAAA